MSTETPVFIEPADLYARLDEPGLVIIDLCKPLTYPNGHLAGAVHMDYGQIIHIEKPVMGLLPGEQQFSEVLGKAGISPDSWVVAYDDEGGGRAARLLWTLAAAGHRRMSLLNGGIHAWVQDQLPLTTDIPAPAPTVYPVSYNQLDQVSIDADALLAHLDSLTLVDSRTHQEFSGEKKLAEHAGHIPGAVNINWTDAMDQSRGLRLLPDDTLRQLYAAKGVTTDKNVAVYCHSHHRSAHTFFVLRHLGFERVRGYPGSWSDWGNRADMPVETGG
ncbi:MAG: sulfurtransferase [Gammaproteobacteria bacterium]|nr:sulfurtransferase [Gammaproteobacteria bacterium]